MVLTSDPILDAYMTLPIAISYIIEDMADWEDDYYEIAQQLLAEEWILT